ncbi:hypothetical protein AAG906_017128 [Vitis piasezkii]
MDRKFQKAGGRCNHKRQAQRVRGCSFGVDISGIVLFGLQKICWSSMSELQTHSQILLKPSNPLLFNPAKPRDISNKSMPIITHHNSLFNSPPWPLSRPFPISNVLGLCQDHLPPPPKPTSLTLQLPHQSPLLK